MIVYYWCPLQFLRNKVSKLSLFSVVFAHAYLKEYEIIKSTKTTQDCSSQTAPKEFPLSNEELLEVNKQINMYSMMSWYCVKSGFIIFSLVIIIEIVCNNI